jgi:hypothetical protein
LRTAGRVPCIKTNLFFSVYKQGPPNPDVFQMPNDNEVPFMLEEIVKGSKIVQEEILFMLNQVNIPQTNSYKNKVST